MMYARFFFLSFVVMCLVSCGNEAQKPEERAPELRLESVSFDDLPGWGTDDLKTFIPAFSKSCQRIVKAPPDRALGALEAAGTYARWQEICAVFLQKPDQDVKTFVETYFQPQAVLADDEPQGLFTGYYEASLWGSRVKSGPYQVPLYMRADDLVMVELGDFRDELKGQRIAGRVVGGNLKPYESRAEIVAGNWPHNDKVLVWVDSAVDAFFVQIQGSGIVDLAEGGVMRIGYAGQNGHPYYAIGRELIKRGVLTKDNVSMQTIRAWLEANPMEAIEVMNSNASYVFFQELDGEGPLGGEGVALTPGRSLAVDRSLMSYGMPVWMDIEPPIADTGQIQRLMVMQDTGGAIRGPVRGDVFWGHGELAEELAGPMKSKGRYWILLPRE